jgi:hypothetical protein
MQKSGRRDSGWARLDLVMYTDVLNLVSYCNILRYEFMYVFASMIVLCEHAAQLQASAAVGGGR